MSLDGMPQRKISVDVIVIASPDPLPFNEPSLFEIKNNSLNGSFGNPHLNGDFPEDDTRIGIESGKHMCVIRQKRPPRIAVLRGIDL
jgi:hypothetical protein